jgi:N-acyl-D-amino-acid deacylase
MPRLIGHYVRDEHLLLAQAIRKITPLPAQRERLRDRGLLKENYFADITTFDPATIQDDLATCENPTQLSESVKYVFVNGELEYEGGHPQKQKRGESCMGQEGSEPASDFSRLPSPLSSPSQRHRFEE